MTKSNRILNRLVLFILGAALIAAAAIAAAPFVPALDGQAWIPVVPAIDDPLILWAIAGAALLLIALSVGWIATRGRGRSGRAVDTGDVVIDDAAVAGILRDELDSSTDVLGVSARGFSGSGGAVLVQIQTRSRADLPELLGRVRAAVSQTDSTIGAPVPLVIHLTTGIRTATTGSRTTQ